MGNRVKEMLRPYFGRWYMWLAWMQLVFAIGFLAGTNEAAFGVLTTALLMVNFAVLFVGIQVQPGILYAHTLRLPNGRRRNLWVACGLYVVFAVGPLVVAASSTRWSAGAVVGTVLCWSGVWIFMVLRFRGATWFLFLALVVPMATASTREVTGTVFEGGYVNVTIGLWVMAVVAHSLVVFELRYLGEASPASRPFIGVDVFEMRRRIGLGPAYRESRGWWMMRWAYRDREMEQLRDRGTAVGSNRSRVLQLGAAPRRSFVFGVMIAAVMLASTLWLPLMDKTRSAPGLAPIDIDQIDEAIAAWSDAAWADADEAQRHIEELRSEREIAIAMQSARPEADEADVASLQVISPLAMCVCLPLICGGVTWHQRWRYVASEFLRPLERQDFFAQLGRAFVLDMYGVWAGGVVVGGVGLMLIYASDMGGADWGLIAMCMVPAFMIGVAASMWLMMIRSRMLLLLAAAVIAIPVVLYGAVLPSLLVGTFVQRIVIGVVGLAVVLSSWGLVRCAHRRWCGVELDVEAGWDPVAALRRVIERRRIRRDGA